MSTIYLTCFPGGLRASDVVGYALAEDGTGLGSHLSSSVEFSKHDMGLTSDWKHKTYTEHYPDGFELVWIDNPDEDERWLGAVKLNHEKHKAAPTISVKDE